MNDMERRKFEESFKAAFKDAEVQPSEKVWTNVELDLIKAEGEKMKRRIFFYQMLAAASISFAVIFAGVGFYALKENRDQRIALNRYNEKAIGREQSESPASRSNDRTPAETNQSVAGDEAGEGVNENQAVENVTTDKDPVASKSRQSGDNRIAQSSSKESVGNELSRTAERDMISSNPSDSNAKRETTNAFETASANDAADTGDRTFSREKLDGQGNDVIPSRSGNVNTTNNAAGNNVAGTVPSGLATDLGENQVARNQRKLPPLHSNAEPQLIFHQGETVEADPVALMFARLNDLEKELAKAGMEKDKSASKEKLWTSVGFAAGAFNAISGQAAPQAAPSLAMTNNSAAQNQTRASGVAYSMGVTMGTRVAERWVVQGGVNYLTEMSDYTSTQAVQESGTFKAASVNQFRASSSSTDATEKFIPTAPYTVNNSNEYLSIPLQAGYLIIKRKIQWQLNAGVSTDLFLQNTVDPEGNIAKTTSGAGDESPFRTVNFSGLVGSEVSYRFSDRYRIGLNPGLRYPLNSIYKDNLGLESSPLTFDIGLRFRYIFK